MTPWDGSERRKEVTDHDTLIEVVQILKNHVANFDSHRKEFQSHVDDDKVQFSDINKTIWKSTGYASAIISVVVIIINIAASLMKHG